ncbi:MAG: hypothetical protein EBS05_02760 [Proteobacteria bacterium]|nr:hypothetical protein [Pseudomonadota bacterium]
MKPTLLFVALLGWFSLQPLPAADTPANGAVRVFVCGHSFHIFTARILPELAQLAGLPATPIGQQMLGGSRTLQHWNLPDEQNKAKAALRAGSVDVLTLSPHMLLPDEGIDNFTKLGLEKNPRLRVLVQASWPANDGRPSSPPITPDERSQTSVAALRDLRQRHHDQWLKNLEMQIRALNRSVGHDAVFIVPVSDAVFALRERIVEGKAPGLKAQAELFRDPLGHATPPLALLVTYCQFAAIYQRSPVGLPVHPSIKTLPQAAELNALLQQLAWEAVSKYPMSGVKSVKP